MQLAGLFTLLEELKLEVKRSHGNAAEIARCRALGRLPRLRQLQTTLDAGPPPIRQGASEGLYPYSNTPCLDYTDVEPWHDERRLILFVVAEKLGLGPHRDGHLADVLLNSAVDADLARAIVVIRNSARVSCSQQFQESISVTNTVTSFCLERVEAVLA